MEHNHEQFRAVLTPNRSLSRAGFVLLMGFVGTVSFAAGLAFLLMGAWPVFGFFGLDVLLIYWAFRLNFRESRRSEIIEVRGQELQITKVAPDGGRQVFTFNAPWVRVVMRESFGGRVTLTLRAYGRELAIGDCLTDDEKRGFGQVLRTALASAG